MEKLGRILLVMMPLSAFGPEIPRNAKFVNSALDASLSAIEEELSKEYVMPTRLSELCSVEPREDGGVVVAHPCVDVESFARPSEVIGDVIETNNRTFETADTAVQADA